MIKRILPLAVVVCLLVACFSVSASADILDPYEDGTVLVDGNLEIVTVKLNTSGMFWQRFHDGADSYNAWGTDFTYSTQMRYVDNDTVSCWPFGIMNYIDSSGIPTGSKLTVDMAVGLNVTNQSQNFECVGYLYLDTYDSRGINLSRTTVWSEIQNPVIDQNIFFIEADIDTALLSGSDKWALVFSFDFNGVSNESDTTQVTLQCFGENISVQIPYSSLYQLQQQGVKTNKLLDQIDKQMVANGEKLDDVLKEQQSSNEKLDEIINGTVPDVRPDGSDVIDDMGKAESDLMNDIGSNLDDAIDIQTDALSLLNQYLTAFAAATFIFECFSTLPFFSVLLTVSLSLSVIAVLFSLSASLGRASGRGSSGKRKGG